MKVGICASFDDMSKMEEKFQALREEGFSSCQLLCWKPSLWTGDNAVALKELLEKYEVQASAFWCGWEGPSVWNIYKGPKTLGLVPPEYRQMRIGNLFDGADFAKKLGVTDVITHMRFIPENPNDPEFEPFCDAVRTVAKHLEANGHDLCHEVRLGDGKVDFYGVFKKLHELGYDSHVTIEREISGAQQTEDIRYEKNTLRKSSMRYTGLLRRAFCDVDPEQFASMITINQGGEDVGFSKSYRTYTDLEEMLEKEELDIIDICLPSYLHCEYAVKLLKRGYHVQTEKPMGLNTAQCEEMLAAAKESGKCLMVGMCLRFEPLYLELKKLIDEETYGKVYAAHFERLSSLPGWSYQD